MATKLNKRVLLLYIWNVWIWIMERNGSSFFFFFWTTDECHVMLRKVGHPLKEVDLVLVGDEGGLVDAIAADQQLVVQRQGELGQAQSLVQREVQSLEDQTTHRHIPETSFNLKCKQLSAF